MIRTLLVVFCCASQISFAAMTKSEDEIPALAAPRGAMDALPQQEKAQWEWYLAAALLAVGAALAWPRRAKKTKPLEPPCDRARRALRELQKPDATALGRIVREYAVATLPGARIGNTFADLAALMDADLRWTPGLRGRFRKLADPIEIAKFAPNATPLAFEQLRDEALTLISEADALSRPTVPDQHS